MEDDEQTVVLVTTVTRCRLTSKVNSFGSKELVSKLGDAYRLALRWRFCIHIMDK